MLKLRLRCTGKTPYDSNQQLSLQATINPSVLFIKLYATLRSLNARHQLRNTARIGLDCPREAQPSVSSVWTAATATQRLFLQYLSSGYPSCSDNSKFSKEGRTSDRARDSRRSARYKTGFGYGSLSSFSGVVCLISCPGVGLGACPSHRREAGDGRVPLRDPRPAPCIAPGEVRPQRPQKQGPKKQFLVGGTHRGIFQFKNLMYF